MPYEIDFLPVGDAGNSGDAIAVHFTHPTTGAWTTVIVDAGYQDDGEALVEHVEERYKTSTVDLAILTHPDGDHIGGMGEVVRGLFVRELWLHDIGGRGGSSLPAAKAVNDLVSVAAEQGTRVLEAWQGAQAFDGALTILGPSRDYYEALVKEQVSGTTTSASFGKTLVEAARGAADRIDRLVSSLGFEIPFAAKDVSPRNSSSMITLLEVDGDALLLTADAGTEALDRALDYLESVGRPISSLNLDFVQVPHHGSRRNGSSAFLDRLLGSVGQLPFRTAFVSCVAESEKHPSGKIVNAFGRRGCAVFLTAGLTKWHRKGVPDRWDFSTAAPMPPMIEEAD